jgi:GTP-binding protein Era
LKVKARASEADAWINKCMYAKAAAVAINPIPGADIAGGAAVDVVMVRSLAAIYGRPFSMRNAEELLWTIGKAWGGTAAVEAVTHTLVAVLKGVTWGLSTIVTAVPQAAVAAWSTYVIGRAANVYFENGGGWGDKEPKTIIEDILKGTDSRSILAPLGEQIRKALRGGGKSGDIRAAAD